MRMVVSFVMAAFVFAPCAAFAAGGAISFALAPLNARIAGMGQAGELSLPWEGWAIRNPATLAAGQQTDRFLFAGDLKAAGSVVEDVWGPQFATALRLRGSIARINLAGALSVLRWETDDIPQRDKDGVLSSASITASEAVTGLALAARYDFEPWGSASVGTVLEICSQALGGGFDNETGLVAGGRVVYEIAKGPAEFIVGASWVGWNLAEVKQNGLGDTMPAVYGGGFAVRVAPQKTWLEDFSLAVTLALDFVYVEQFGGTKDFRNLGLELSGDPGNTGWRFSARYGMNRLGLKKELEQRDALGGGVERSLGGVKARLDYAYLWGVEGLGSRTVIGLQIRK